MKQNKVKETSNSDLLIVLEKKKHHTFTRVNFLRSLVLTKFFPFSKWRYCANHLEIISYPPFLGCQRKSSHLSYTVHQIFLLLYVTAVKLYRWQRYKRVKRIKLCHPLCAIIRIKSVIATVAYKGRKMSSNSAWVRTFLAANRWIQYFQEIL
jgi:hypothetical protein